jgi:hypothetical protein
MEKIILALGVAALLGASMYMLNEESTTLPVYETAAIDPQVYDLYGDWKKKYNKKYSEPDQDWYRLTVFNDNYNIIKDFFEGPD